MNPDKCYRCHQRVDMMDPDYCVWRGYRWHVECAMRQVDEDIERTHEKQHRYDTTAANYAALEHKIDSLRDERAGLTNILQGVPEQAQQLGLLFMKNSNLVKRDLDGQLLEGSTDPRTILELLDGVRDRIEHHHQKLIQEGSDV